MKKMLASTAILSLAGVLPALTADIGSPPVIYPPIVGEPVYHETPAVSVASGWYLRGDAGFGWNRLRGASYATTTGTANFTTAKLKSSFSAGLGVGYKFNQRFRSDLTLDYLAKTKFEGSTGPGGPCTISGVGVVAAPDCVSKDVASYTAWSLLANAYVDLFTYGRVTGYAGAGLGMTYIDWNKLENTECQASTGICNNTSIDHVGQHGWRATAALMAGASVKITCALAADVNYRYRFISGGGMFKYNSTGTTGPGVTEAIHSHEGRAGLRYSFGGCADSYIPPYEPPALPPVYK